MTHEYLVAPTLAETLRTAHPQYSIALDAQLAMYGAFVEKLIDGAKRTTVRFKRDTIRVPARNRLSVFITDPNDPSVKQYFGEVSIPRLAVTSLDELTDEDGVRDGFSGRAELVGVLEKVYGRIPGNHLVSIYHLR